MDSLTQIVLGASMGELVAGRKLGNKAMLWGAIAGTIPDLDVLLGATFLSPIDSLAFHRGISHSIFFAFLAPIALALYTQWFYKNNYHAKKWILYTTATLGTLFLLFSGVIANAIPIVFTEKISWITLMVSLAAIYFFSKRLWTRYINTKPSYTPLSFAHWYLFFFITIITHPILDSCTGYGTQLLQPFSDARIAWDNISVADPLYTGGYLLCLIIAANIRKNNNLRQMINGLGILWSLLYMGWTIHNKSTINDGFQHALHANQIEHTRCLTTPTIFNNILWHCVADSDSVYYDGFMSINDTSVMTLTPIEKNHDLIKFKDDKRFKTLRWFTNDYFTVHKIADSTFQLSDMRYGRYVGGEKNNPKEFKFAFILKENNDGKTYTYSQNEERPSKERLKVLMSIMWRRITGSM